MHFCHAEDVTPLDGQRGLACRGSGCWCVHFGRWRGDVNHLQRGCVAGRLELRAFLNCRRGAGHLVSEAQAVVEASDWTMQIAAVAADNQRVGDIFGIWRAGVNGAVPLRADGKEMRLAARTDIPPGLTGAGRRRVQLTISGERAAMKTGTPQKQGQLSAVSRLRADRLHGRKLRESLTFSPEAHTHATSESRAGCGIVCAGHAGQWYEYPRR